MCVSTARMPSGRLDFPELVEFLHVFDCKGFGTVGQRCPEPAVCLGLCAGGSGVEAAASICNPFPSDPLVSVREHTVLLLYKTSSVFIPPGTSVWSSLQLVS